MLENIAKQDLSRVRALLVAGAPVNGSLWRRFYSPNEPTPLQAAVRVCAREIVDLLIKHGADPNLETRKWMAPLSVACQQGDLPIARMLVEHGALVNPTRKARHPTPIEAAAWHAHEEVVEFLLDSGADPDPVFERGIGSLVRIKKSILKRLIAAGGHAPQEVERLVLEERW
jgi:ankyrin repeat protein